MPQRHRLQASLTAPGPGLAVPDPFPGGVYVRVCTLPRPGCPVNAGGDLRNFVGDTSRPATDKTLRGAVKPYLDALLATGWLSQAGDSVALVLTAEIVAGERAVPVSGSLPVTATRRGQDPLHPPEAAPD